MFSRDDLTVVTEPLGFIQTHPENFLPEGRVSGESLVLRLISDILVQPNRTAIALRLGAWWVVASDEDWISRIAIETDRDPFTHIVAFAEAGPNSMHAEVLITAYAQDVVTYVGTQERKVKGEGDENLLQAIRRHPEWRRSVAFRLRLPPVYLP